MHFSPKALLLIFTGTIVAAPFNWRDLVTTQNKPDISPALQRKLEQACQAPLYDYPTSLTQGVIPKAIHSHNDYWQPVPVFTALSVGAISIEADVWLEKGKLLVGHERAALTKARTFESLYIKPILEILKKENPSNQFVKGDGTKNGVFDTDAGQTLYLFVDVKTEGNETFEAVIQALEPLREGGWLSSVDGENFTEGAVTVIGTGNTPPTSILPHPTRCYFYDAPITLLSDPTITALTSPIASSDFHSIFGSLQQGTTTLNDTQLEILRTQVDQAHDKRIKLRYWNQPVWPVAVRDGLWLQFLGEGVDFINVDDLVAAGEL